MTEPMKKVAKVFARRISKVAHENAGKLCLYYFHQPKVPAQLRKGK